MLQSFAAAPQDVVAPAPDTQTFALNQSVAEAASIYVTFIREVGTFEAGFQDAAAIQATMEKGAAYDAPTLSRGLIAYASILALQSPEFVEGLRAEASTPAERARILQWVLNDPSWAATLPGADAAAGLIVSTLGKDIEHLTQIANAVEEDAYTIQGRNDPRRRWAITPIANRETRLETAKTISGRAMLPSPDEATRLFAAAVTGRGLVDPAVREAPPYTPVVARALTIAVLAVLGAAGDDAKETTDALLTDSNNEFCFSMSKLDLFQCLAASRPSYEDMFCIGRHIVRDLATCAAAAATPPPPLVVQTQIAEADAPEAPMTTPTEMAAAATPATSD